MSLEQSGKGRKTIIGIIWTASLVIAMIAGFFAATRFQGVWPGGAFSGPEGKRRLIIEMRLNLARAAEKEKCAVIAQNDDEAAGYADQSRAAAAAVDRDLSALERLIGKDGAPRERELLRQFRDSWKSLQQIDGQLLLLESQNTDMKAIGLANTIGADLLQKFHDDLVKLPAKAAPAVRRIEFEKYAAQAETGMLNLAVLQMRHISAQTPADKNAVEASMRSAGMKIASALRALETLNGRKGNAYLKSAYTEYTEYLHVNAEIVRLSRLNSNNSSIEISLGKKRLADTECDRNLKSLLTAIATEGI